MGSYLIRNVTVWDGIDDDAYPGEVLVEGNYITGVAKGSEQIDTGRAKEVIDGIRSIEAKYPGLDSFMIHWAEGLPPAEFKDQLTRFAKDVMPAFRKSRA